MGPTLLHTVANTISIFEKEQDFVSYINKYLSDVSDGSVIG